MYSFDKFSAGKWSLVITSGEKVIFRSQAGGVGGLVRFLKAGIPSEDDIVIYDKYVGRAAALLMALIKPVKVYTPVISEGGKEVLERHGIPYRATRLVKYLMGMASDEMCRWEKMCIGKTPEEFWDVLK